jgi:transposase
MGGAILSPEDRAELLRMMRRQTPSTVHRRMNALLLLDDGWAAERVAEALFIDAETVREHRRLYQTAGVVGVLRLQYEGSEPALGPDQLVALGAELDARLYLTAKAVAGFVRQTFGVEYTPHAMAKLLNRLGFVYKMPKSVPAKADAETQRRFVEATLAPLMAAADADKPLYFVDATHPSYTAHPGHGWIRKGETRELKSNHGRVNVNINGALRWPEREVVHREAAKITSAEMIKLFDDLQARHPTATAIRVVLDNARYNHSAEIRAYVASEGCRIELVYLPTYAPNLNLIERLWWLLKRKTLYNEHFPTFADFKAAVHGFFANLASYRDEIHSLITGAFHYIGKQNPQAP